jgi:nucleoside-diphosphate-sugar epimerase
MTKVLITGANSFIGTNFLKISENQNATEISLKENQPEDIDFSQFEVVLHLAAIVHQSNRINEKEYFRVNRDLCLRVAEHAKKSRVRQFIFLSTVKVYGKYIPGTEPWNEDSVCNPDDPYGRSKYEAELALKKMEEPEFIVSIIRTPIVYGPGVMANILKLIKLIEIFPILPFRQVNNHRHYTYVENLVGFIDRIIQIKASGTFIAMDDTALSTTDLVLYLSGLLHRKPILFKFPDLLVRLGSTMVPAIFERLYRSFYMDNIKTKKILNYIPLFTTEEGLSLMISSYVESKRHK